MTPPKSLTYTTLFLILVIVVLPIAYMVASPLWMDLGQQLQSIGGLFEGRQLLLIRNSLSLSGGTVLACLITGVPFAFLCHRTDLAGKSIFLAVFILPVLIPPYIHAIIWSHMNGFVERYLFFDIHSIKGTILVLTCAYFPFVVLATLTGLKGIDRNLEEASLLHQSRAQTFYHITLPLIMPYIFSGATFVFVFSIMNISVPDFLRVKAYPLEIFIQFSAFYNEFAATLLSLPLIFITFFLIGLQKIYMKDRSYIQLAGGQKNRIIFKLNGFQGPALFFCTAAVTLSTVLPIVVLIHTAGPFSTYIKVFKSSCFQIGYSLNIAFWGSLMTVFLGFFMVYWTNRSDNRSSSLLTWIGFLPFAVPATTIGIGLIGIWNRPYIDIVYSSSLIIIIGYVVRFIPFAMIVFMSGISQLSRNVEEAAIMAGSSFLRIIAKVVFPLLQRNILTVFFIVFILSVGELSTTLLIIPPGRETLPIKIYNLMHYGAEKQVAALCLILIGIIFFLSALFNIGYRKAGGYIRTNNDNH